MNYRGRSRVALWKDMGNKEVVCPKPRHVAARVTTEAVQTYKPVRMLASHTLLPAEGEAGHEILEILFHKACTEMLAVQVIQYLAFMDHHQAVQAIHLYMMYISHKRKFYPHHCFFLRNFCVVLVATLHTRSLLAVHPMGQNPMCALRALHVPPLMLIWV